MYAYLLINLTFFIRKHRKYLFFVAVIEQFNDVKLKKTKFKYIIYKIEGPEIVTEKTSESGDWNEFLGGFPDDDGRYALYDMDYETNDGRRSNKLVFISWVPDTAKVKAKMTYAGSKEALIRAFVGVTTKINATDMSEITEEAVMDACKKFT